MKAKRMYKQVKPILAIALGIATVLAATLCVLQATLAAPGDAAAAPRYGRLTTNKFVDISIGYYFGGALDDKGQVWVYGTNGSGQLGNGKSISTTKGQGYAGTLQVVPNLPQIQQFSAGESYGLAVDAAGELWGWGYNCQWQAGNFKTGGNVAQRNPIKLDRAAYGIPLFAKADAGVFHSVALDVNGGVWSFGLNNAGQLGNGKSGRPSNATENKPTQVIFPAGTVIVDVQAGRDNNIALDSQGKVWVWGRNSLGECANGKTTFVPTPIPVNLQKPVTQISLAQDWALALDTDGNLWQWGAVFGYSAFGVITYHKAPIKVEFDSTARIQAPGKGTERAKFVYDSTYQFPGVASIQAGHRTSYVIDANGKLWTWGDNEFYGFGVVTDYYAADYCRVPIWSRKAVQSPTITGNGDQNISGKQLSFLHPQVSGSASDPKEHLEYTVLYKKKFPTGFWNETGLGIDPAYAKVDMPYASKITTFESTYIVLDADGNLWVWSYDSIGTICWGSEPMQVALPSHAKWADSGLWDLFIYEPVLMRGAGIHKPQPKTTTGDWTNAPNHMAQISGNTFDGDIGAVVEVGVKYAYDDPDLTSPLQKTGAIGSPFHVLLTSLYEGNWYYAAYVVTDTGDTYQGETKTATF
jgi:alpha-tubulin suppressor-like RCC1 family protein